MKTPTKVVQSEIQKAARQVERAMARRRRLLGKLTALDEEIRAAKRALTMVVADATAHLDADPASGDRGMLR